MKQKKQKNMAGTDDRVCDSDPKYTAELLVRSYDGSLSKELEADLHEHLKECERCRNDYESLSELDFEMLLISHDDDRLREFNPDSEHAQRCLLTTWDRLERFAEAKLEDEFISDEELEKHIDQCVYCRRRSIIVHRRIKYRDRLPLAYRLAEQAIQSALGIAWKKVWDTTLPQEETKASLKLAAQDARPNIADSYNNKAISFLELGPYTTDFSIKLSSGDKVDISVRAALAKFQFPHTKEWIGKSILVVAEDGQELRAVLSDDALGSLRGIRRGKYQIVISKNERHVVSFKVSAKQLFEEALHVDPESVPTSSYVAALSKFPETDWEELEGAKSCDKARRRIVVGNIIRRYWKPVYFYLRKEGFANDMAEDLTQDFFYRTFLSGSFFQHIDLAKCRFRMWLQQVLDRYVINAGGASVKWRSRAADIAQPEAKKLLGLIPAPPEMEPERAFYYVWASGLLNDALSEVKREFCGTGRAAHWEVFHARLIAPMIEDVETPSLAAICEKYGINRSKAWNMIVTVKHKLRAILKRRLRNYVRSDSEVEEEFRELFKSLSRSNSMWQVFLEPNGKE